MREPFFPLSPFEAPGVSVNADMNLETAHKTKAMLTLIDLRSLSNHSGSESHVSLLVLICLAIYSRRQAKASCWHQDA